MESNTLPEGTTNEEGANDIMNFVDKVTFSFRIFFFLPFITLIVYRYVHLINYITVGISFRQFR